MENRQKYKREQVGTTNSRKTNALAILLSPYRTPRLAAADAMLCSENTYVSLISMIAHQILIFSFSKA